MILCGLAGVMVARLPDTIHALWGEGDWPRAVREVEGLISARHVSPPPANDLYTAAIDGMVDLLDDPYTEFVPPQQVAEFEKDLTGQFVGIGATITSRDGLPQIISPMPGSPALRAGLRPGDRILEVDGQSTRGLSLDQNIERVMGEPGTTVTLTVERVVSPGPSDPPQCLKVPIVREAVSSPVVSGVRWDAARGRYDYLLDERRRIAYVRLDQFTPTAADELRGALLLAQCDAGQAGLGGVVLDVRDNPGGMLDEAIRVAGLFVERGVLVTTRAREGSGIAGEKHSAPGGAPFTGEPVVVLVSEASASASEIVAGAMQDRGRAIVVGTRTYGKGVVQTIEPLHTIPGALLKLTEQHYYLPSGRLLHRTDDSAAWGVDPTPGFHVPMTDEQRTTAYQRRQRWTAVWPADAQPHALPGDEAEPVWSDPASIRERASDPQLAGALDAVQKRIDTGTWVPTGETLPSGAGTRVAGGSRSELQDLQARLARELNRVQRRLDAVDGVTTDGPRARRSDLWPDAVDLTGGIIEIKDRNGAPVARLRITGPVVEPWLLDADVEPEPAADPAAGAVINPPTGAP